MKSPYKVLFSNDLTNIETCVSPYHEEGEPFRPEMLEASVDETVGTGVEVHMLQPGLGWVPFWKSKAYPFEEHVRFVREEFGEDPADNGYASYLAGGGDIVQDFVVRCRQKGLSPFVSLRLNDCHGHEVLDAYEKEGKKVGSWAWHALTPVHVNHSDWRIGQELTDDWTYRALNWIIPEVREQKFSFVKEIIEQYDIDGFELDFLRYCSFFDLAQTTSEERAEIMTGFVRDVREVLDRTEKPGQHRWLCVRVPCYLEVFERLGIDLPAMVEAGVDMVNLSTYFFTEQQTDMAAIKKMIPDASVYLEMCHCTQIGAFREKGEYDEFLYRPTTPTQYYTGAHLAYSRGLDGVSTFNFVYSREHGLCREERGPFSEPPFDVFRHLGDPEWLAEQPQHYILGQVWNHIWHLDRQIPRRVEAQKSVGFSLDMAPPKIGWKQNGRLRIKADSDLGESGWRAIFNGVALVEDSDRSEPYWSSQTRIEGTPEEHRAWIVPVGLLKDGYNEIEITLMKGEPTEIVFLDVAAQ